MICSMYKFLCRISENIQCFKKIKIKNSTISQEIVIIMGIDEYMLISLPTYYTNRRITFMEYNILKYLWITNAKNSRKNSDNRMVSVNSMSYNSFRLDNDHSLTLLQILYGVNNTTNKIDDTNASPNIISVYYLFYTNLSFINPYLKLFLPDKTLYHHEFFIDLSVIFFSMNLFNDDIYTQFIVNNNKTYGIITQDYNLIVCALFNTLEQIFKIDYTDNIRLIYIRLFSQHLYKIFRISISYEIQINRISHEIKFHKKKFSLLFLQNRRNTN
jgi:hypothetical protein